MYVTVNEIIMEYQLKPKQFGFKGDDADDLLEALVEKWIQQASNAIDKYLERDQPYPSNHIPGIISLACTEAVGNIITNRRLRQDGSYIKSDDWTKDLVSPLDILKGVRELLKPLTNDYDNISCFAITYEDIIRERQEEE